MDTDVEHPVRAALLDLLASAGTVTSNEAARRLGISSGLTSFHLRQLARAGVVEEAPSVDRRSRPWRLARRVTTFDALDRDLEDESYHRWLSQRDKSGQADEAFSAVVHVNPAQMAAVAREIRAILARYASESEDTTPAGAIIRLFPLL